MSIGATGVVGNAFGLARRNLLKVVGIYLIFGIAASIVNAVFFFGSGSPIGFDPSTGAPSFSAMAFLGTLLSNILMVSAALATYTQMTADAVGAPVSFTEALQNGLRKTPIGIVVALVLGIVVSIIFVLPVLFFGGMSAAADNPSMMLIGVAILLPISLLINAAITPLFPALVIEDAGFGAISRSLELTKGYRWGIVGASILLMLAMLLVIIVGGGLLFLLAGGSTILADPGAISGAVLFALPIYFAMIAFLGALGTAFQAAVYARLAEG